MESSMEFTDKSLMYKGFKINTGGVQISPDRAGEVSPFMLKDIKMMEEIGRLVPRPPLNPRIQPGPSVVVDPRPKCRTV